jgi:DNA-binding response OmpR family regulator
MQYTTNTHMSETGLGVSDALRNAGMNMMPCSHCMLIVEDFDGIRAVLARHFEREGFTVYSAATPHDAHVIARSINPMIVIVDYDLSDSDSLSALQQLRDALPHSIIILYGGVDSKDLQLRALQSGATDVLANGYELSSLDRLISQARVH